MSEQNSSLPQSLALLSEAGWTSRDEGSELVIVLTGDWIARRTRAQSITAERLSESKSLRSLSFDATRLGHWDSALIVFLWKVRAEAAKLAMTFDQSGLPPPARRLLALAPDD